MEAVNSNCGMASAKLAKQKFRFVIVTKAYKSDLMKAKLVEKTDTTKK